MEVLRYGSRGSGVLLLQLALQRGGWYRHELDGIFGTRTLNALRRFQTAQGLKPDGIAGVKTREALEPYLFGSVRVRLRAGDSFYRLARRFGTSEAAVAAANPTLDPNDLRTGGTATVPLGFSLVPEVAASSRLTGYIIRGLALRYPFIAVEEYGRSVLGSPLYAAVIGEGETGIMLNAAHHANEWITTPLVLGFAESLLEGVVSGGSVGGVPARELFSAARLYVLPMVDPDGVDLVTGALPVNGEGYRRAAEIAESRPEIPFPEGWKANIEGVDLNLNYPADWEEAKRIKYALGYTSPAPRDFVGEAPLCAPEARAVYEYTLAHDIKLAIAYHTQGREIYWRFKDIEPEGGERIGRLMAEASGYALADVPLGSSNAGYRDWFIMHYRLPGYTVEAGSGVNPLPISALEKLKAENYPLIAAAIMGAAGR